MLFYSVAYSESPDKGIITATHINAGDTPVTYEFSLDCTDCASCWAVKPCPSCATLKGIINTHLTGQGRTPEA